MQRENQNGTHTHTHTPGRCVRRLSNMKPRRLPQATVRTELSLTNESESASVLSHQIVRYFRSPTLHLLPKQWQLDSSGSTGPRRIQKHKKNILMWKLVRALLVKSAFGRAVVVVMAVGGVAGWRGSGRWEGGGGGGCWLLLSLLSAPSLGQACRLCWAARFLGSRCEPSCQRQAVARRSAAPAHTSLSHLP